MCNYYNRSFVIACIDFRSLPLETSNSLWGCIQLSLNAEGVTNTAQTTSLARSALSNISALVALIKQNVGLYVGTAKWQDICELVVSAIKNCQVRLI